jgi:hypothetical protein
VLIRFEPLVRPVAFLDGTEKLLEPLAALTVGWQAHPIESSPLPPLFTVSRRSEEWRIDAPWLDSPLVRSEESRIVGNIAVDLSEAYLEEHPELLSLHGAAALFAGRLVVFPARVGTGKSTLCGRLAAEGLPIFCDDILVLTGEADDHGQSLGIAPRLRLPLPPSASVRVRSFFDDHVAAANRAYLYLRLPPETRPAFGRSAPVGAIVLLDRRDGAPASLQPASRGDGLETLVLQRLWDGIDAADTLRRLRSLIERTPCYRLVYSDLDEACATLRARFDEWEDLAPTNEAELPADAGEGERPFFPTGDEPRFSRCAGIFAQRIDDSVFLASKESGTIYRLGDLSLGIWNLLAQPTAVSEAVAILHKVFPDVELGRIDADVRAFLSELADLGLIQRA